MFGISIFFLNLPDGVGLGTDPAELINAFPLPFFKAFPKSNEISQNGSIVVDTLLQTWHLSSDCRPPVNILSIMQLQWCGLSDFSVSSQSSVYGNKSVDNINLGPSLPSPQTGHPTFTILMKDVQGSNEELMCILLFISSKMSGICPHKMK